MRVRGDHLPRRPVLLAALVLACAGATCGNEGRPGRPPPPTPGSHAPGSDDQPRVGNPSNTGMDTIPDWEALARELRERVGPRMPDPLPTDPAQACADMLDAARAFYAATEVNPEHRRRREAEMDETRTADLAACVEHTSLAAASCVTILLSDHSSEFPWLLDQCSRAYPRE